MLNVFKYCTWLYVTAASCLFFQIHKEDLQNFHLQGHIFQKIIKSTVSQYNVITRNEYQKDN